MENNEISQGLSLKGNGFSRLLSRLQFAIIFPWKSIRKVSHYAKKKLMAQNFIAFNRTNVTNLYDHDKFSQTKILFDEVAGLLNWPELLDDVKKQNGFNELMRLFYVYSEANIIETPENKPSNCWVLLAVKNLDQLLDHGYNNFKRTIGHNYFNFLIQENDSQIKAAESLLSKEEIAKCHDAAKATPHDPTFSTPQQFSYNYFLFLLWEYAKKIDKKNYLARLEEPMEGNPLLVHADGKSMSQDLANSLIEYYSIDNAVPFNQMKTVLEIGGGYGRNAHVILSLNPNIRMVLVDIMPAIYIAQRYLSSTFRNRKIFKTRNFSAYEDVRAEMERASIIFLLPHQLALLPDKAFDLCINISSFGEMSLDQIKGYFDQINRLSSRYFYMKQWDLSKNPFDAMMLQKKDYPYPANWQEIYSRNCAVQNEFFEALYEVKHDDN